jgi:hypothetical protein
MVLICMHVPFGLIWMCGCLCVCVSGQVDADTLIEQMVSMGFDRSTLAVQDVSRHVVEPFVKHLNACIALSGGYWRLPKATRLFVVLMKIHELMPSSYVTVSATKPPNTHSPGRLEPAVM